jgi:hypothetical protein
MREVMDLVEFRKRDGMDRGMRLVMVKTVRAQEGKVGSNGD